MASKNRAAFPPLSHGTMTQPHTSKERPAAHLPPLRPSDMEHTKGKKRQHRPGREAPELEVVEINYSPSPDTEERLRRLFKLLIKHAARHRQAELEKDSLPKASPDDGGGDA